MSINVRRVFVSLAIVIVTAPAAMGAPADVDWLVERVQSALPATWRVVEADSASTPVGWSGEASGLYAEIEDTRTRFFHPNGFHYYSFYRVWLMPSSWEGEMRKTPYVSDSAPAYLLGASDRWLAFYHTAGGNVWDDGLTSLCTALGLDRICYAETESRIVDLAVEERLSAAAPADGEPLFSPNRIVGLVGEGPNLYLEYVFPAPPDDGAPTALSDLTARLAETVFSSLPEIESLYLRRCTVDSFTDTIVQRD